jgi:hypothetical protein
MQASLLYRIASVLLVLFALAHTLGFRKVDARWKANALVDAMRSTHFDVHGFERSYWKFYTGFGLFVTVLLLFVAALCWQLSNIAPAARRELQGVTWSLAACFAVVTVLTCYYFFLVPIIVTALITLCLAAAAYSWMKSG